MQYVKKGNLLVIRLFRDEDVINEIKTALKKSGFKNGVILSGIGMLEDVELRVFKGKGKYAVKKFRKDWELVSFSGNIVKTKDDYILHIHSSIADHQYRCFAGHFGGAKVAVTLELFVMSVPVKLLRKTESDTGLTGLFLR
ncbi:MAG: DNA-binding protein [Deltaproteobacteria bacterium]|nr:DNA-binding protein [Deltaproteobacteria bacterium]